MIQTVDQARCGNCGGKIVFLGYQTRNVPVSNWEKKPRTFPVYHCEICGMKMEVNGGTWI